MNIWKPDPGETLLARSPVSFATGAASRVRGMRWFRDPERNDIQHELAGWPDGPDFTARSVGGSTAHKGLRGVAKATGVAVMAMLGAAGGNVSGSSVASTDDGSDFPDDPANEVDDFPVLWAAPMTIARTLPWQLDPGRIDEKHTSTHLIVTDRRLVVVVLPYDKRDFEHIDDEPIWQCPLTDVASVVPRNFKDGDDFSITFADDSWCRLKSFRRQKLMRYLAPRRELIPLGELSPQQQKRVLAFATEVQMPDSVSPNVTHNEGGRFHVEILLPSRLTSAFGATEVSITMDTEGREIDVDDYLPGDF
ncbi:hypothetical protein [Streptomyces olivaceus]|uniref:hypothetical protein n=1 Tax=Streptomyces olivaceus TaxID=47716 RepID=UPI001CCC3082|nr:hypothetical protein [Streptomyces olivaceus]MBZ6131488.1 hypothetical protein [Streptomyces olivaceus]